MEKRKGGEQMSKWFVYDNAEGQTEIVATEEEARKLAEEWLEIWREASVDEGWEPDFDGAIGYGEIKATNVKTVVAKKEDYTDEEWTENCYDLKFDEIWDYDLEEERATYKGEPK